MGFDGRADALHQTACGMINTEIEKSCIAKDIPNEASVPDCVKESAQNPHLKHSTEQMERRAADISRTT